MQELNARHGEERDRRLQSREVMEEQRPPPPKSDLHVGHMGASSFFRGRQYPGGEDDYYEDGTCRFRLAWDVEWKCLKRSSSDR